VTGVRIRWRGVARVAAIVFVGVGFAVGMVPKELRDMLGSKGLLRRGPR